MVEYCFELYNIIPIRTKIKDYFTKENFDNLKNERKQCNIIYTNKWKSAPKEVESLILFSLTRIFAFIFFKKKIDFYLFFIFTSFKRTEYVPETILDYSNYSRIYGFLNEVGRSGCSFFFTNIILFFKTMFFNTYLSTVFKPIIRSSKY